MTIFSWDVDESPLPIRVASWDFTVKPLDVYRKFRRLNPQKSIGPDVIPMKLLIIAAETLFSTVCDFQSII